MMSVAFRSTAGRAGVAAAALANAETPLVCAPGSSVMSGASRWLAAKAGVAPSASATAVAARPRYGRSEIIDAPPVVFESVRARALPTYGRRRRSEIRRPGSNRMGRPRGLVARLALATQPPDERWDRLVRRMAGGDRDALA